ncbi:MAG TPA: helix-turn-helix domain-containing protein [Pirellulales bacterium]|nr:helix-turn-helix domain-containing protein [Pirellulales bacterium]
MAAEYAKLSGGTSGTWLQCLTRFAKVGIQPDHSLGEYLTVGEAADFLGVSASTLRNWDRAGKLKANRHPINGYRLYKRADLETLNQKVHDQSQRK